MAQSFRDFELIIVNDGSNEATSDILKLWAGADARARVIHQSRQGIVGALRRAAVAARGQYIARMDADDLCAVRRFERQLLLLEKEQADVCSCRVAQPVGNPLTPGMNHYLDWLNGLTTHEQMALERFIESPVAHPSVLMRREAFESVGGYRDRGWAEDYDLWLRLFETGARFVKSRKVLLYWRDSDARASREDERYSLENFLRCKVHYLCRSVIPSGRRFRIWGAGRYGKLLAKALIAKGRPPEDFIDIDPKKIGGVVSNVARPGPEDARIRVVGPERLGKPGGPLILSAVGGLASAAARDLIRITLNDAGFREGEHYWCVA